MTTEAVLSASPQPRPSLSFATGRDRRRRIAQRLAFLLLRGAILVVAAALFVILGFLVKNGISAISWEFLTEAPRNYMTEGGVWPCIVGTLLLSLGAMAVALPLGVASAIYLHEYALPGKLMRIIRLGVSNLAGVPSVVFGLFGLGLFVTAMDLGVSLLSGWLTL
ncbi:MAG: phosphate ABC transporter, permease protein PstA, partial [Desulfovibrio sp.]|nr:phosphate ABC transporter, permease protein PstA [Desulfovibrio sp.]